MMTKHAKSSEMEKFEGKILQTKLPKNNTEKCGSSNILITT